MSTIMEHSKLLRLYISISINIDIQLFEGFNNKASLLLNL